MHFTAVNNSSLVIEEGILKGYLFRKKMKYQRVKV